MAEPSSEHRNLLRQVTLARPIFLVLALVDLLEAREGRIRTEALAFVTVYLLVAVALAVLSARGQAWPEKFPLWADAAALAVFLWLTPSVVTFWFLFLFVAFASGMHWPLRGSVILAAVAALGLLLRTVLREPHHWPQLVSWVGLVIGTFSAGTGIAFLGAVQRRHAEERDLMARLSALIRVERGMAESLRGVLQELLRTFRCDDAMVVLQDDDLERLFVWQVNKNESGRIAPQGQPLEKADAYLMDCLDVHVAWNSLDSQPQGFAWRRADGRKLDAPPRLPGPSRQTLRADSLLAVSVERDNVPSGRVLLLNGDDPFTPRDLRRLERIARQLGPALENLYALRHLRAHSIETERARIAHDLHDGILQTLLSVLIQLDVLRRKLPQSGERVATELAALQQTLRHESEELRRMVTDLRPLRVQSADLLDLMRGFGDRFRNETGVPLDLLVDSPSLQMPDRICREIFQIYREALNNVKKHAKATHVVVKLWQDEERVTLVVDDNGQGFSFAGRFTSDELDRLRLGPISIKERTRVIGGVLTVESNPGHGARLTIEVPLN
jgi:signal transduction histidine kinase